MALQLSPMDAPQVVAPFLFPFLEIYSILINSSSQCAVGIVQLVEGLHLGGQIWVRFPIPTGT